MITYYWSRKPGEFVDKKTGIPARELFEGLKIVGPKFTGTVREWYETLIETLVDLRNACIKAHRLPAGSAPSELRVGADVLVILECSLLYRPHDNTLGKWFVVKRDDSLPRDTITVGEAGRRHVGAVVIKDFTR